MSNMRLRAVELSMYAHHQHNIENFHHAVAVAKRVDDDPRSDHKHVAAAYLIGSERDAGLHSSELLFSGIPPTVVHTVERMAMVDGETFLAYLKRVSEDQDAALVAFHDFEERLTTADDMGMDFDSQQRLRNAISELRQAVSLNAPRSG